MTIRKKANPVTDDCTHFNSLVPYELRHKLLELAKAAQENFIADLPGWPEAYGTADISAVYGYDPGGFMPFQLGGFEVTELYRSDVDSTYHITKAQTEAMNKQQDDCYKSFALDNREVLQKAGYSEDEVMGGKLSYDDFEKANLQNEFSDYENDWFEPALLRLEMWIEQTTDEDGHKCLSGNIFFRLGLGYRDQPYYRSEFDEQIFKFSLTIAQMMMLSGAGFTEMLTSHYEKAEV